MFSLNLHCSSPRMLALALTMVLALGAAAQAADEKPKDGSLALAMQELAADIGKRLKASAESDIAMGAFDGPGVSAQSMQAMLKKNLELIEVGQRNGQKVKVRVTPSGAWRVSADIFRSTEDQELLVTVEAKMKDRSGRSAGTIVKTISQRDDVLKLFGATVDIDTLPIGQNTKQASNKIIEQSLDTPDFEPVDSGVAPSKTSPFSVVIEVDVDGKGNYAPLPATNENGLAFVDLQLGQEYAIRVVNHSGKPVGVEVSIDGINMFAFSKIPSYQRSGKIFLASPETRIEGWHVADGPGGSKAFLITEFPQSAQALIGTKDSSRLGTINVLFRSTWKEGEEPPPQPVGVKGEPGTGLGQPKNNTFKPTRCFFGAIRASVSIRYTKPAPKPPGLP